MVFWARVKFNVQFARLPRCVWLSDNFEFCAVCKILYSKPLVNLTLDIIFAGYKLTIFTTFVIVNMGISKIGRSCYNLLTTILCK